MEMCVTLITYHRQVTGNQATKNIDNDFQTNGVEMNCILLYSYLDK